MDVLGLVVSPLEEGQESSDVEGRSTQAVRAESPKTKLLIESSEAVETKRIALMYCAVHTQAVNTGCLLPHWEVMVWIDSL